MGGAVEERHEYGDRSAGVAQPGGGWGRKPQLEPGELAAQRQLRRGRSADRGGCAAEHDEPDLRHRHQRCEDAWDGWLRAPAMAARAPTANACLDDDGVRLTDRAR